MILSVKNVFCLGTVDMDKIMFLCRRHCLRNLRQSHCLQSILRAPSLCTGKIHQSLFTNK